MPGCSVSAARHALTSTGPVVGRRGASAGAARRSARRASVLTSMPAIPAVAPPAIGTPCRARCLRATMPAMFEPVSSRTGAIGSPPLAAPTASRIASRAGLPWAASTSFIMWCPLLSPVLEHTGPTRRPRSIAKRGPRASSCSLALAQIGRPLQRLRDDATPLHLVVAAGARLVPFVHSVRGGLKVRLAIRVHVAVDLLCALERHLGDWCCSFHRGWSRLQVSVTGRARPDAHRLRPMNDWLVLDLAGTLAIRHPRSQGRSRGLLG